MNLLQEIAQAPKYADFLNICVPSFIKQLQQGEPQFISESPTQVTENLKKLLYMWI